MSAISLPKSCILGAVCALAVGLCGVASVRADDFLNKFKAREQLDAQRATSQIKGLIADAAKVRTTDPRQAQAHLQNALKLVNNADSLPEAERASLRSQVQSQLTQLDGIVRERDAEAAFAAKRAEEKAIKDLRDKAKQGGTGGQPFTVQQAKDFIKTGSKALEGEALLKYRREAGVLALNREIMESNAQLTEERITQRFIDSKKRTTSKYTKAELELIKALNSVMSVDFNKNTTSLKDALDLISERAKLPIFLDEESVKAVLGEGNDYDTVKVGFKVNKVTVRTILKKILADQGLTFIIKEAAVQVMSPAKANDPKNMVVRAYPVQDLIQPAVASPNPYINQAQMYQAVHGLMLNIMSAVEPGSWAGQSPNGSATITFHQPSMSLIIRQHAEFHYQMGGVLGR